MTMNINRQMNKNYNHKRIYRSMERVKNFFCNQKKEKKYTKNSAEYKAENILNRKFSADIPQHKVLTDITEFKYGKDKKIYMCAALDLYDRSILSYSLSEKADTKLVLEVLRTSLIRI